jgi:hypothetical protein
MLHSAVRVCTVSLVLSLLACSGMPTSPTDLSEEEIARLWTVGQQWLLNLNAQWTAAGEPPIPGDVRSVRYTRFFFISHSEPLFLDGEQVGGYFEAGLKRIHYQEAMMQGAIPHEACHAILYELGDPRWRCVFHDECDP